MSSDKEWLDNHTKGGENKTINAIKFDPAGGVDSKDNQAAYDKIQEIFTKEPWKTDIKTVGKLEKIINKDLNRSWKELGGNGPDKMGGDKVVSSSGKGSGSSGSGGQETEGWHPDHAYKITVKSNFSDNWYTKNFKSGLINSAIRAVKTSAMHSGDPSIKNMEMKDHTYTQDEMLP